MSENVVVCTCGHERHLHFEWEEWANPTYWTHCHVQECECKHFVEDDYRKSLKN